MRVEHVRGFEPSFGDEGAVDAGGRLDVIVAVSMDDPVVNLVDAGHLVRGVLTLADGHHLDPVFRVLIHWFDTNRLFVFSLGLLINLELEVRYSKAQGFLIDF